MFIPLEMGELLRIDLATDAVAAVLGTMNEHTFVNIVVFSDEVSVKCSARVVRACLSR